MEHNARVKGRCKEEKRRNEAKQQNSNNNKKIEDFSLCLKAVYYLIWKDTYFRTRASTVKITDTKVYLVHSLCPMPFTFDARNDCTSVLWYYYIFHKKV